MMNTYHHNAGKDLAAERKATIELVALGLKLADKGVSISESAIHTWMHGPKNAPFPKPDTFE